MPLICAYCVGMGHFGLHDRRDRVESGCECGCHGPYTDLEEKDAN